MKKIVKVEKELKNIEKAFCELSVSLGYLMVRIHATSDLKIDRKNNDKEEK